MDHYKFKDEDVGSKDRVDIVTNFLRIRQFIFDDILPRHFGREWLNNLRTSYVITAWWTQPD